MRPIFGPKNHKSLDKTTRRVQDAKPSVYKGQVTIKENAKNEYREVGF